MSLNPFDYGQGRQVAVTTYLLNGFVNSVPSLSIKPILQEEAKVFKLFLSFIFAAALFVQLNLAWAESVSTTISYRLRVTIPESAGSYINTERQEKIIQIENGAVQQVQEQLGQRNNQAVIIRSIVVL